MRAASSTRLVRDVEDEQVLVGWCASDAVPLRVNRGVAILASPRITPSKPSWSTNSASRENQATRVHPASCQVVGWPRDAQGKAGQHWNDSLGKGVPSFGLAETSIDMTR
jgi:hypothetical protein